MTSGSMGLCSAFPEKFIGSDSIGVAVLRRTNAPSPKSQSV